MPTKSIKKHGGKDRQLHGRLCLLIAGACFSLSLLAGPLGLPDSARPGAVRPDRETQPVLPEVPPAEVVDIPAVIDRPFDVEEGPFVVVQEFRLLDAQDLPRFDINVAEIQEKILDKFIKEQPPTGFSIGQIQEISDEVTKYYREKGLILAQAVLPVQTVQSGVVDIQIFEGILGRVLAEGNEQYDEETLKKPFEKLLGQPVTKDEIEAALLTLTDFPGLSIFGVFQPGLHVGTADIVLKTQEEKRFDVAFRIDNHGLQTTGRNRFRTTIDWNNPTGGADIATVTVQQTYNPKLSTFWAFDYEHYLGNGYSAGGTWTKNVFDVGGEFAINQIHGETKEYGAFVEKSFIRSRQLNLASNLSLMKKQSDTRTRGLHTNQDKLTIAALEFTFDSVDGFNPVAIEEKGGFGGGLNFATLRVSHGFNRLLGSMGSPADAADNPVGFRPSRQGGPSTREFAEGKFTKVDGSYSRLQLLTKQQSFLFRTEFQWAREILVPMEQYSVGGPENVRAFPEAQSLFDRAFFMSFEYIHNAPFIADQPAFANRTWGELLQFSIFYDFAVAQNIQPLATEIKGSQNFKGAGVGLRFNLPGSLDTRLLWASEIGGDPVENERAMQFWGDLTYSF